MREKRAAESEQRRCIAAEESAEEAHRAACQEEEETEQTTTLVCSEAQAEYECSVEAESKAWARVKSSMANWEKAMQTEQEQRRTGDLQAALQNQAKLAQELEDISAATAQASKEQRLAQQALSVELQTTQRLFLDGRGANPGTASEKLRNLMEAQRTRTGEVDALFAAEKAKQLQLVAQGAALATSATSSSTSPQQLVHDAAEALARDKSMHAEQLKRSAAARKELLSSLGRARKATAAATSRKRKTLEAVTASKRQRRESDEQLLSATLALQGTDPDHMEIVLAAAEKATEAAENIQVVQEALRKEVLRRYGAPGEDEAEQVIGRQAEVLDEKMRTAFQAAT